MKKAIVLTSFLLLFVGCFNIDSRAPLNVRKNYQFRNGTIAVLATGQKRNRHELAKKITQSIASLNYLRVMSQGYIKERIQGYPYSVLVNWEHPMGKPGEDYPVDWISPENLSRAHQIQSILGIDYLLLVVIDEINISSSYFNRFYFITVEARLLDRRHKEVVGYTSKRWRLSSNNFTSELTALDDAYRIIAEDISSDLQKKFNIK